MRALAVWALLIGFPSQSPNQGELPPLVARGLDSLRIGRCEAAFDLWTEQWTDPEDTAKRNQIGSGCALLAQLGEFHGFDLLRAVNVSPRVQRLYMILRYAKRPVYFMIVLYNPESNWHVLSLNWNTDYDKVIPATIFGEERPRPEDRQ